MNKPIKPDITIPQSFAENGVKTDFDDTLLADGFDNLRPDVLAGDNLNKFIDDTYKGLNYGIAAADAINLINEGETLTVINGQLTSGASGGGLEIGDIGFTQMAIDESKGKRRALNKTNNIIIQEQYPELTKRIKATQALDPDLFCTESEWQTELTMSANGVCYKYVIDDEAGTIRLPKYPSYFIGGVNGIAPVAGNGLALGIDDGSGTYKTIGSCIAQNISHTMTSTVGYGEALGVSTPYSSWISTYTSLGVTSDPTKSGIEAQIKQEQIKGTYFIQVATGAETEDNIINEHELINPYSFGDSKYSQIELNNLSWLLSLGQWNSKADYTDYYNWILTNANEGKELFKLSTEEYDDYCWVVNTADETFRLPLLDGSEDLVGDKYINLTLGASGDTYIAPANGQYILELNGQRTIVFTRITSQGRLSSVINQTNSTYSSGAEISVSKGETIEIQYSGGSGKLIFTYAQGNGNLYFYVGDVAQNPNIINAGRIEEKLANCITRNDCKAYITETYVNGASWYRVYSDGWCEQGGRYLISTSGSGTITFLKEFIDNNYTIVNCKTSDDSSTWNIMFGTTPSWGTSSITIKSNLTGYQLGGSWLACGYIK